MISSPEAAPAGRPMTSTPDGVKGATIVDRVTRIAGMISELEISIDQTIGVVRGHHNKVTDPTVPPPVRNEPSNVLDSLCDIEGRTTDVVEKFSHLRNAIS